MSDGVYLSFFLPVYPTGAYILKRKKGLHVTRDRIELQNHLPVPCDFIHWICQPGVAHLSVSLTTISRAASKPSNRIHTHLNGIPSVFSTDSSRYFLAQRNPSRTTSCLEPRILKVPTNLFLAYICLAVAATTARTSSRFEIPKIVLFLFHRHHRQN